MANEWSRAKKDFEPDGALRDIYVLDSTIEDWDKFVANIRDRAISFQYSVNGQPAPLPSSALLVFDKRVEAAPLLAFSTGSVLFTCHFFASNEIECSFDPREVESESALAEVTDFMVSIRAVLKKDVLLTPENMRESPILKCEAKTALVVYCEPTWR